MRFQYVKISTLKDREVGLAQQQVSEKYGKCIVREDMKGLGVKERLLKFSVQQIGVLVQPKGIRSEGYLTVERPLECEIDAARHRTMDPDEMPAVPFCPSNSTTGREAAAPCGTDLGPRRAIRHCAHCHNHGITDQVKDEEHSCLFEACECHKDALFSENPTVLPAESALRREQGRLNKHLPQGLIRSGAISPKAHSPVKKLAIQGGAFRKLPGYSADRPYPRIFVSILDSSSLEDATDNFSFQGFPEASCTAQRAPKACDQASVSASEWQQKLEAAEALLSLKLSPSPFWLHFAVPSLHRTG
ncbi:Doublesex- And Mab-3-Related Transcription Factor C2 [Manis pentadactyla]|nr:Doublesex- And Mab-3-Related Transcription Factor C2 [Manis pentadactyla]